MRNRPFFLSSFLSFLSSIHNCIILTNSWTWFQGHNTQLTAHPSFFVSLHLTSKLKAPWEPLQHLLLFPLICEILQFLCWRGVLILNSYNKDKFSFPAHWSHAQHHQNKHTCAHSQINISFYFIQFYPETIDVSLPKLFPLLL